MTITYRLNKMPTPEEIKSLNWIQVVYEYYSTHRPRDKWYEWKECTRYKILKNGNCKTMTLFYGRPFDNIRWTLDTNSSSRSWKDCSLSDIYNDIQYTLNKNDTPEHIHRTAYLEANGDEKLEGRRTRTPAKKPATRKPATRRPARK